MAEIRYIVKSKSIATEENENFKGSVHYCYHGKEDYHLSMWGEWHKYKAARWELLEYGYKRECDAKRNWSYNHPQNDKHWKTKVEILKITIK